MSKEAVPRHSAKQIRCYWSEQIQPGQQIEDLLIDL